MGGALYRRSVLAGSRRILLLTALGLGLSACGEEPSGQSQSQATPPTVGVDTVVRKEVTPRFEFVGRVEAIESVDLLARVEGFLEKVEFEEGSDVSEGQVLYQIEQDTYKAEVDARTADVAAAQATLENSDLQLERAQSLSEKGNVSQARLDELEADEKRAVAEVQQKKAALEEAQLELKYTTIISPIDGRIGRTNYTEGNLVNPNSGTLATVVSLDPIYVRVPISERDLLNARRQGLGDEDQRALPLLRLSDGQDYPHSGEFTFIDNKVDPNTDTITVRATFPNPKSVLLPNQFVTVIVKSANPKSDLVVPQAAVQEDQTGRFVLVVDDKNMIETRQVELGLQVGRDWVVRQGLEEGEMIVVQGLQKVRPGVTVVPEPVAEAVDEDS